MLGRLSNYLDEATLEWLLGMEDGSRDPSWVSKPGWLKLGFPLMYQTDILEILGVLVGLGYRDERMAEAIESLRSKGGPGRPWSMENSYTHPSIH